MRMVLKICTGGGGGKTYLVEQNYFLFLLTKISIVLFIGLFVSIGCGGSEGDEQQNDPQNGDLNAPENSGNSGDASEDGNDNQPGDIQTPSAIVLSKKTLSTSENGQSDSLTVRLGKAPTADVIVPVVVANMEEGIATPTSLTFTPNNWDVVQSVTISGVDDNTADGDTTYYLTFGPTASADANFTGASVSAEVTNVDDEAAAIVLSKTAMTLSAGAPNGNVTVALSHEPVKSAIITARLIDANAGTLNVTELTFSPYNWNVEQNVIVQGAFGEESLATVVEFTVTSQTPAYEGKTASVALNLCSSTQHDNGAGLCVDGEECIDGLRFINGVCRDTTLQGGIEVPAGNFVSSNDGTPITIEAFSMTKTETTVAQFKSCVEQGACSTDNFTTVKESSLCNYDRGDAWLNHPMNCVNWYGADEYCKWIGARLPTVDEWQYAATHDGIVATQTAYPWGNDAPIHCAHANYRDDESELPYCNGTSEWSASEAAVGTSAVGTYSPLGDSPLGFQDMISNVHEWSSNCMESGGMMCVPMGGRYDFFLTTVDQMVMYWDATQIVDSVGFRCAQ